jgi:rhodanese-related sulfurtransferase
VKFFIDSWYLVAIALLSGGMLLWPVIRSGGGAGSLGVAQTVTLMNREKAVVIDVCEQHEFDAGHILGAKHIPLGELEAKLPAAVKNKELPVVLVCVSGVRSGRGVAIARKLGYNNCHSLSGGMVAWREAGLPVEKA